MDNVQKQIVKEAAKQCNKLNAWEVAFIDSLIGRPDYYELSEKQNEHLNRIGNKME